MVVGLAYSNAVFCVYGSSTERNPAVGDREKMQADREVKAGHYIQNQDMKAWLLS
jgi:hypothetical protein